MTLTVERLRAAVHYDPVTGVFVWKESRARGARIGGSAGIASNGIGYARVGLDGRRYLAHRLAWFYVHGEWPENDIDHINRRRLDNRMLNLRQATRSENLQNKALSEKNTSGRKGVYWHKRAGKWLAQIKADGKHHYLGLFSDIELAARAYQLASVDLHSHRETT